MRASLALIGLVMMVMQSNDGLRTRAELTNFEETTRYEEVTRYIAQLQQRTSFLRVESFGKSEQGRDLPLMIFANPAISTPSEAAATGKAVVFVMANIHAGEVEGKEAVLALSRRIIGGDLASLLDKIIILIAPIYNADGNEKISLDNRTEQNGPIGGVGTRENANGRDLNRDYMKLETAEARSLIELLVRWDPHLTVDLHTTNGSYHSYHLTYAPTLNPNADSRLIAFERDRMLPEISKTMLSRHKYRTYYYGNFTTKETIDGELRDVRGAQGTKIWRTFDHRPRFGNNYVGLRNRLTILSEAYSYLDFKGRVGVTSAFVEEILRYSAANASAIVRLLREVDRDKAHKTAQYGVAFELQPLPKPVEILAGEIIKQKNPRNGKDMSVMLETKFTPTPMPDYGLFRSTRSIDAPRAYILRGDPGLKVVADKLLDHGITVEELTEVLRTGVESYIIDNVAKAPQPFQGHLEVKLSGRYQRVALEFPAGSILVRMSQPLSPLIFYLLEAESDDGLANWNFLDAYLEKGKAYPIHRIAREPAVATRNMVK